MYYVSMLVCYEAGDESGRFRVPRKLKSPHHDIKMRYFLYSTRKDLTSSHSKKKQIFTIHAKNITFCCRRFHSLIFLHDPNLPLRVRLHHQQNLI